MHTKLFWIFIVVTLIVSLPFFFLSSYLLRDNKAERNLSDKRNMAEAVVEKNEEKTKYLVTLEGDALCAYKEDDGKRTLIHSKEFEPIMTMDSEDVAKLKDGIYAENYEDMVLYFESYLS